MDWTGLWIVPDWTELKSPKQVYTDSKCHQGYNRLSQALSQVAS